MHTISTLLSFVVMRYMWTWPISTTVKSHFDSIVPDCSYSSALAMELLQSCTNPDNKFHGANMGLIWVQQDPGGPHVGPMNFAISEAMDLMILLKCIILGNYTNAIICFRTLIYINLLMKYSFSIYIKCVDGNCRSLLHCVVLDFKWIVWMTKYPICKLVFHHF